MKHPLSLVVVALAMVVVMAPTAGSSTQSETYLDASLPEVPSGVAVSDEGTVISALFDAGAVAVVKSPNSVITHPLGCSPEGVDISPDGLSAWAVCPFNPHVYVIDNVTNEVAVAGIDLIEAKAVADVPDREMLVIADFIGELVLVTTTDRSYEVVQRIETPGFNPVVLAALSDGSGSYMGSADGRVAYVDFRTGEMKLLRDRSVAASVWSLSLSKSETRLYAGAVLDASTPKPKSAILALNPITGRVLQQVPLTFTLPATTYMNVAAGHRSLSVSTGLAVRIDGQETGTFTIALDGRGRMGGLAPMFSNTVFGSGISRSPSGRYTVVGTTSLRVIGAEQEDPAYPSSLGIKARMKASTLSLSGATTGLRPGTRITVHIAHATKQNSRFVAQKARAVVDRSGNYTWSARTKAKHVKVYVSAPDTKSATVTVRAARS